MLILKEIIFDISYVPSEEIVCQLDGKFEEERNKITLIIEDKKRQVIKEEKIITEKPDEWSYAKYFGDLKWLSNNEVALISKNKDYEFIVKIEQS